MALSPKVHSTPRERLLLNQSGAAERSVGEAGISRGHSNGGDSFGNREKPPKHEGEPSWVPLEVQTCYNSPELASHRMFLHASSRLT